MRGEGGSSVNEVGDPPTLDGARTLNVPASQQTGFIDACSSTEVAPVRTRGRGGTTARRYSCSALCNVTAPTATAVSTTGKPHRHVTTVDDASYHWYEFLQLQFLCTVVCTTLPLLMPWAFICSFEGYVATTTRLRTRSYSQRTHKEIIHRRLFTRYSQEVWDSD